MTSPELIDPQLSAFWASNPSQLTPPAAETPEHHSHDRLAVELAAAVLLTLQGMRAALSAKHQTIDTAGNAIEDLWGHQRPLWLRAATPAIRHAYELGQTGELSHAELDMLATDYAASLGDYLNETSGEALLAGLRQQLSAKWNERIAWQRAAAGYGLDARDMRNYLSGAMIASAAHPDVLLTPAARVLIDRALLARADRLGQSEAWTVRQAGMAIGWMYLDSQGRLPAGAMKEWDTAEDEATCGTCAPLDGVRVALDDWFELPGGKVFAPQAHPGCRCRIKLVVPEPVEKAWDSDEHPRGGPRNAGEFTRKSAVRIAEPGQTVSVEELTRTGEPGAGFTPRGFQAGGFQAEGFQRPPAGFSRGFSDGFEPIPADGFGPELSAEITARDKRRAGRVRRINRTLLVLPADSHGVHRGYSVYLGADEFNLARNQDGDDVGTVFPVNTDVDFGSIRNGLHERSLTAERTDPWSVLDDSMLYGKRNMNLEQHHDVAMTWAEIVPGARSNWTRAVYEPERYVPLLSDDEVHEIGELAGYDPRDRTLRNRIVTNTEQLGAATSEDTSLAQAYADFVTYQHPEWFGENGKVLSQLLESVRDANLYLADEPVEQVFVFNPVNTHPGDRHGDTVVPTRNYAVVGRTYRSALHDFDVPPPLRIGLSEAHLAPFVQHRGSWVPPGAKINGHDLSYDYPQE